MGLVVTDTNHAQRYTCKTILCECSGGLCSIISHSQLLDDDQLSATCRPAQMNGHVCQALDFMHANKHALLERYDLMGSDHRSFGSFGVVQIATVKRMPVRPG